MMTWKPWRWASAIRSRNSLSDAVHCHVAGFGRLAAQLFNVAEHAEVLVHVPVVAGVVLVQAVGLEDRVQVDRRNAQPAEVGQRLPHALQVAAVAAVPDVAVEVAALARLAVVPLASPGDGARRVVARVAVAEPLRQDLVPDGVLGPVGRDERRRARHVVPPRRHHRVMHGRRPTKATASGLRSSITKRPRRDHGRKPVHARRRAAQRHRRAGGTADDERLGGVVGAVAGADAGLSRADHVQVGDGGRVEDDGGGVDHARLGRGQLVGVEAGLKPAVLAAEAVILVQRPVGRGVGDPLAVVDHLVVVQPVGHLDRGRVRPVRLAGQRVERARPPIEICRDADRHRGRPGWRDELERVVPRPGVRRGDRQPLARVCCRQRRPDLHPAILPAEPHRQSPSLYRRSGLRSTCRCRPPCSDVGRWAPRSSTSSCRLRPGSSDWARPTSR